MISEFSQMVHSMVLDSPIPARDLAKAVGKPYSTLLREINPYDTGAKLGAETYFQLIEQTGDLTSLEFALHKLGLGVVALDEIPDEKPVRVRPARPRAVPAAMEQSGAGRGASL